MEIIKGFTSYEQVIAAAEQAGINDSKLENAVELYSLPKTGTFKELVLKQGENAEGVNMSHLAITTDSGEIISLSALQRFGFFGSKTDAIENLKEKVSGKNEGTFTLRGVECKNPKLTGNQAKIGLFLQGKKFKANPVDGFILDYKESGYSTIEEAEKGLIQKTFYEVSLLS